MPNLQFFEAAKFSLKQIQDKLCVDQFFEFGTTIRSE